MTSLPPRLFCNTSFFYACFDPSDANHECARAIVEEAAAGGSALSVTWDVVVRTLLKNTACLAFDEDFRALGLTVLP